MFSRPRSRARRMPPRSRTWAKDRSTSSPRRLVAVPAQIALGRLGFGDARRPRAIVERLQLLTGMIALVGDQDAGRILARRQPDRLEVACDDLDRRRKRRRIAFI